MHEIRRWRAGRFLVTVVIGYAAGGLSSAGAQLCPVQTPAGSETLGKFSAPFEEPTVNGVVPTTHCDAVGCKCAIDADGTTLHCKPAADQLVPELAPWFGSLPTTTA